MQTEFQKNRSIFNNHLYLAIFIFAGFLYVPIIYNSLNYVIIEENIPWPVAELLINYEGGFVRRGLLGQIALWMSKNWGVPYVKFFSIIFISATLINFCNLYYLLSDFRKKHLPMVLMVILSPSLLMFPVYDTFAYLRKEILFISLLLTHASVVKLLISEKVLPKTYRLFTTIVLGPALVICLLVHELQIFLLPAHLCLTAIAVKFSKNVRWSLLLWYLIPATTALLAIKFSGTDQTAQNILHSWDIPKGKGSAIEAIGWKIQDSVNFSVQIFRNTNSVQHYVLGWILAVIVPSMAVCSIISHTQKSRSMLFFLISLLTIVALSPAPLFFIGWDFGRWISITSFCVVAVSLAHPINLHISQLSTTPNEPNFNLIALFISIFYITLFTLPHCCLVQTIFKNSLTPAFANSLSLLFHKLVGI